MTTRSSTTLLSRLSEPYWKGAMQSLGLWTPLCLHKSSSSIYQRLCLGLYWWCIIDVFSHWFTSKLLALPFFCLLTAHWQSMEKTIELHVFLLDRMRNYAFIKFEPKCPRHYYNVYTIIISVQFPYITVLTIIVHCVYCYVLRTIVQL